MGDVRVIHSERIALSARLDRLAEWFTPARMRIAWDLAVAAKRGQGHPYPAVLVGYDIGRDMSTIGRWKRGEATPDRGSLDALDRAMTRLLGEDWTSQVAAAGAIEAERLRRYQREH